MTRTVIMGVLVVIGIIAISVAKVSFQRRQIITPDNVYSPKEKTILYIGYAVMAIAFIIAAFINF